MMIALESKHACCCQLRQCLGPIRHKELQKQPNSVITFKKITKITKTKSSTLYN